MKIVVPVTTVALALSSGAHALQTMDIWDPFRSLFEDPFFRDVGFYGRTPSSQLRSCASARSASPSTGFPRMQENDQQLAVMMELPGYHAQDFDVGLHERTLTVLGKHECPTLEKEKATAADLTCVEHQVRETIKLDREDVDWDSVRVHYNGGVLSITMDKVKKLEEGKRKLVVQQ